MVSDREPCNQNRTNEIKDEPNWLETEATLAQIIKMMKTIGSRDLSVAVRKIKKQKVNNSKTQNRKNKGYPVLVLRIDGLKSQMGIER